MAVKRKQEEKENISPPKSKRHKPEKENLTPRRVLRSLKKASNVSALEVSLIHMNCPQNLNFANIFYAAFQEHPDSPY